MIPLLYPLYGDHDKKTCNMTFPCIFLSSSMFVISIIKGNTSFQEILKQLDLFPEKILQKSDGTNNCMLNGLAGSLFLMVSQNELT